VQTKLKNGYIVDDRQDGSPITIITATRKIRNIEPPTFMYHDVDYSYGLVIFIGETNMQLISESGEKITLDPAVGYHFLKTEILEGSNGLELVTLSGGIRNLKHSLVCIYQISRL